MPRFFAAHCALIVSVVAFIASDASASWAQLHSQWYEVIGFDEGISEASKKLCKSEAVKHCVKPPHGEFSECLCQEQIRETFLQHFNDTNCHEGGLYRTALEDCLDALAGAMHDHWLHIQDANIVAPLSNEVVEEYCLPSDVCHVPAEPLSAAAPLPL